MSGDAKIWRPHNKDTKRRVFNKLEEVSKMTGRPNTYPNPDEQPSPAADAGSRAPDRDDIARLLREVEPWCEWLEFDNDGWIRMNGGLFEPVLFERGSEDREAMWDLFGAICEDIEHRGWRWGRDAATGLYRVVTPREGHPIKDWFFHGEWKMLLLAYRDAIRAAICTCGSEDGWHLADVCPLGGKSADLADVCFECGGEGVTIEHRYGRLPEYPEEVPCSTCNGIGKVRSDAE